MSKRKKISGSQIASTILGIYTFAIFAIYPLYYQNKFYNMGEAKYLFVKWASAILLLPLLCLVLWLSAEKMYEIRKQLFKFDFLRNKMRQLSITDYFVIGYMLIVLISYALTPYKSDALWGYDGWYMGVIAQIFFAVLYFLYARNGKWSHSWAAILLIPSAFVFLFGILHRFQIDPLGLYESLSMSNRILFLSTIGQATWYSSYVCTVFPIGVYYFWKAEKKELRYTLAAYLVIGFATLVTQNSDSAFIAIALMLLVLFCSAVRNWPTWCRFWEIVVIMFASFVGIGLLQILNAEMVVPLEPLSLFFSQNLMSKLMLGISILCLLFGKYCFHKETKDKREKQEYIFGIIRTTVAIVAGVVILMIPVFVYMTTMKILPDFMSFLYDVSYFTFDEQWGNGRGFTWKAAAMIFGEYPIINQLFGCGPDAFAAFSYERYGTLLDSMWGESVLTNAHNEWFSTLLYTGVLGLISYVGIFLSQAVCSIRSTIKNKEANLQLGFAMCIASYMGHNFFCYQQIVCTPYIFIFIGLAESVRRGKIAKNQ